jgi:hypothetical protein
MTFFQLLFSTLLLYSIDFVKADSFSWKDEIKLIQIGEVTPTLNPVTGNLASGNYWEGTVNFPTSFNATPSVLLAPISFIENHLINLGF